MAIQAILNAAIEKKASDIHLIAGRPKTVRLDGKLVSLDDQPLTGEDIFALAREVTTEEQRKKVEEVGGIDFGFSYEGKARLLCEIREDVGDGLSIWLVEFTDEQGETYTRTINKENA